MRKRITCKVIRSVTLGKSDEGRHVMSGPSFDHAETDGLASLTYTSRMVVTKSDIVDDLTARTLDLCA